MSKSRESGGTFVLRINVRTESDVRRYCEVRVDQRDNVYIFQPRKGRKVHFSYHESGQRHVTIGKGPRFFILHSDKVECIASDEWVWSNDFENFSELMPYKGQAADAVFEISLPPTPHADSICFAEVRIGREFSTEGWTMNGVTASIVEHRVIQVPLSPSQISICVQILRLSSQP